eukprot:CAMPEP_0115847798 /NCGR_PEP_ID=MMETSP0287-20121206/10573_1 /TAXON_ID=412157 /ORGANISM="Chrysochromulina rotalis, Strain UIO044" /LENGTH=125 /DNA_ID=CAMNT_0003301653 /DNA_START=448 /DNA_END=821 /DNA_ORIENTATION=-
MAGGHRLLELAERACSSKRLGAAAAAPGARARGGLALRGAARRGRRRGVAAGPNAAAPLLVAVVVVLPRSLAVVQAIAARALAAEWPCARVVLGRRRTASARRSSEEAEAEAVAAVVAVVAVVAV